ncbi:MAG: phosphoribosylaminoimidazolesuccinocarboxamide synthase [Clostridiales bacterium]|nr:phosphoribosylaminoimidazolesuccinocarboxamide synthase [Clostridiales bacterium]
MEKLDMLYEGKAKKVYKTDDENAYIVEYKDDATAFNGLKKGTIAGKGVINNKMSNLMFRLLEEKGIPTHYIEELSDRETAVRKVEIVPLEVIVRNIAAGSFSKRYGVPEGSELKCTILEYSYKNDDLGDPLINDLHAIALGLATREELDQIAEMTLAINEALKEIFLKVGIILVDFKIEFGRCPALGGKIILADEISPDTCRLWDAQTKEKLDKDRFRRDLGGVEEAYNEVFNKLFKKD